MVAIQQVRKELATVNKYGPGLIGVFVGGTSGIGEHTAREFIRYTTSPKVYLVGRNEDQANKLKEEFKSINNDCQVEFIKSDVSLLRNVDKVCDEIKSKEQKINLLFLSAGFLTLKGRDETIEGLDKKFSLHYYSRLRFAQNLLPLLHNAKSGSDTEAPASVISALGAGLENKLNMEDLSLKSTFSLSSCATHAITMNTMAFQHLAAQNPGINFIHTQPGGVSGTNAARSFGKVANSLLSVASNTILKPWMMEPKESGERHLWDGLSAKFPPGKAALVGPKGEESANTSFLEKAKNEGQDTKVWDHSMDVFKKICEENGKY